MSVVELYTNKGPKVFNIYQETDPITCFMLAVLYFLRRISMTHEIFMGNPSDCFQIYFVEGSRQEEVFSRKIMEFTFLMQECKSMYTSPSRWLLRKEAVYFVGKHIYAIENIPASPERVAEVLSGSSTLLDQIKDAYTDKWWLCHGLFLERAENFSKEGLNENIQNRLHDKRGAS